MLLAAGSINVLFFIIPDSVFQILMRTHLFYNNRGTPHFTFRSLFFPHLFHGVFTVHGGISKGPWRSLNVGFDVGDVRENVLENRQRIKETFGISRLVSANQIHGNNVLSISQQPHSDIEAKGYDAIITALPGVALMIQQADCQAVFLYDPVRKAVGIVHAGWRGSVQNIIGETVRVMKENFGVKPASLYAAVSPALGPCCAEFINYQKELPEVFHKYRGGGNNFDFWAISRDQLVNAAVSPSKIAIAGICTVCSPDFFSYRREGITGRFASVVGLYR